MQHTTLFMLVLASPTPLAIQKPVLASTNRPTVEIHGRTSLRQLVRSPRSHRGPGQTAHTARAMLFSVARSAPLSLTQQMRTISMCRRHAGCAASAPLPVVELQILQRLGRLSAFSNRQTAARRSALSGMAATGAPPPAMGPTPKQLFAA